MMLKRHRKTLELVRGFSVMHNKSFDIFDLGEKNELSKYMRLRGYIVSNSDEGIDLDKAQVQVRELSLHSELTTAFEILEHLVNPYAVLRAIRSDKLLLTVPKRVWFSNSYWNKDDPFDQHYHEFEYRQLKKLLDKTGWEIQEHGFWWIQRGISIRPFLRLFWPSYIWVYAERI